MQSNPGHDQVRFNVLGALEVWHGDRRLGVGGPVNERVLATLLLEPGSVVPVSRLVEAVWGKEPPPTATHQIRKAVARLRRRIPSGSETIVTESSGYRMVLDGHGLDLRLFDLWTRCARESHAEGRLDDAVGELKAALELWRGPVLAGGGGPLIDALATAWEERRIAAVELGFDLRLDRGETAGVIADLREAVVAHPFREPLVRRLMLALYRAGRQAEAVKEYARIRSLLAEELGVDPGSALAELHEAILRGAPGRTAVQHRRPAAKAAPAPCAPCALPHDLADFTGRQEELRRLTAATQGEAERTGPRIVVVEGMAGSGKTALAVHAGHRLAGDHPDGQLYLDLRGFASREEPMSPTRALGELLRAAGVPEERIGEDHDTRLAAWRVTSARRRMLLILDNASCAPQVRSLLPTAAGSLVLITSRVRLTELEGAEQLSLGLLNRRDGVELLRRLVGEERVAAEPEAAARLVDRCGGLPLALRICGARLRKRPHWSLGHLADRLSDDTRLLGEMEAGDRSVAGVLRSSYRVTDESRRDGFRLLSLHPGVDFDLPAAAALLGTEPDSAELTLEYLLDVHLLQQYEFGRYAFHGLVRSFARSLPSPGRTEETAAVRRLAAHTVTGVDRACQVLLPRGVYPLPAAPGGSGSSVPPPREALDRAVRWLDRERCNVLAIIGLARRRGLSQHAARLSSGMALCQRVVPRPRAAPRV
ncbi:AfsR/SARP family transcriptional regulator [Streptomyces sp. TS71-3]|uniref:AfsR/SARP family transcriptional regulator n=1 Tax=Streptomyces sp. TS71-3 TaxID=2733862 RepID=UPI001B2ED227|nr:AfsR/SARP family transcriptional regulator [Streptomyces sp. TS71-3]GHJ37214.1 hypothetical protein Sm713_28230 [Streptomyces sp. TS71-3]